MDLTFMQNELVPALCWTLIHSLWQGFLLAAVTGAVMIATRRWHAHRRYNLLTLLFLLFMVVTVITFAREMSLSDKAVTTGDHPNFVIAGQHLVNAVGLTGGTRVSAPASFIDRFTDYFNRHASLIVTIWFIIFIARFIKFTASLAYVQRLKHYKAYRPAEEWTGKLTALVTKLGITRQIRLLESGIVKVPVVLGVFKPVILLPLGLLAHLPAEEIEAILLHELAHIRRRDYFVNLLQSFAETIFFFNPALLWLSSMIRDERENCCDDIAIAVTHNKTKFINALIAFQEYRFSQPSFGMTFPGSRQQLLNRVKRIISDRNKTLNTAEKSILSIGIALFALFFFTAARKAPVVTAVSYAKAPAAAAVLPVQKSLPLNRTAAMPVASQKKILPAVNAVDTVPVSAIAPGQPAAPDSLLHFSANVHDDGVTRTMILTGTGRDGKEYRLKKINDVLKEFSVNGREVPEAEYGTYAGMIDAMEDLYRKKQELGKARRALAEQNRLLAEAMRKQQREMKTQMMNDNQSLRKLQRQAEMDTKRMLPGKQGTDSVSRELMQLKKNNLMIRQKKILIDKQVFENRKIVMDNERKRNLLRVREFVQKKVFDSIKRHDFSKEKVAVLPKAEWYKIRQAEDERKLSEASGQIRSIVADLQKENINIDMEKSWFALDNDRLIVDGRHLSAELHQRLKAKYIKPNGWGYFYGPIQVTGRGIFMEFRDLSR